MKQTFKRSLSLLVCLFMLVGAVVAPVGAATVSANSWHQNPGGNVIWLEAGQTYAYRANILTSFRVFQIMTVTGGAAGEGGSCVINLYRWDTNYTTTLASQPVGSLTVDSLKDNSMQSLYNVSSADVDKFLGADEYLVTVQNTTDPANTAAKVGVQGKNNGETATGLYYLDGVEGKNHDAKIHLFVTAAADEVYGTCSPSSPAETEAPGTETETETETAAYTYPAGYQHHPNGAASAGNVVWLTEGMSAGYRFKVETAIRNLQLFTATGQANGAGATLKLYEWNANYSATTAEEPIRELSLDSATDNYWWTVSDELAAGEYLFVVTTNADGASAKFGYQGKNQGDAAVGYAYIDGAESKNHDARIWFELADATNRIFGICEPSRPVEETVPETLPETVPETVPETAPETEADEYTFPAGYLYHPNGAASAGNVVWLTEGRSAGYRFKLETAIKDLQLYTVTAQLNGAKATLKLYEWNADYKATIAEMPLHDVSLDSATDNYWWTIADDLPAGEYLMVVTSDANGVDTRFGFQGKKFGDDAVGFCYLNGVEDKDHDARLWFELTAGTDQIFGVCEPSQLPNIDQMPVVGGSSQKALSFASSMGVRLNVAVPFSGVQFLMATYKDPTIQISMSVYTWKGTYVDTVGEAPVATGRFTMADNAVQGINFDSLPAGDYLFLAHDPTGTPGMYYHSVVEQYEGVVYREGYVSEASMNIYPQIHITCNQELTDGPYFLPCENPEVGVSGDHKPPAEETLPADSLIHTHPVMPDTWVFTDGLGRVSLTNADVGGLREDKTVAMFYWTWHIDFQATRVPTTLQELSEKYPEAMNDYNHELWASTTGTYFWNEPIYGFYRSDDEWVLRRQAELLTNAGVDVIFTDNTNGAQTWKNGYTALFNTWAAAKADGLDTPKISFMLPFAANDGSRQQFHTLFRDLYRVNLWQDQWFYWNGKPMIAGHTDNLSAEASATEKEILNFFTFRANYPLHVRNSKPAERLAEWSWLSIYPQTYYYATRSDIGKGLPEQISVGVAVNHDYVANKTSAMNGVNIMGRSYTTDYQNRYFELGAEASKWGFQFAEQFDYALEIDPKLIFITGWNEWYVLRNESWDAGGVNTNNAFVDQFNDEFSRDIEPSKGALQDHYYYQLVNYVRRYKGARPIPTPSGKVTIDMTAGPEQWAAIEPYYGAYIGNTDDRNAQGYGDLVYTETSGRNDIIGAQVARDDDYLYFLVECAENITPYTDPLWMHLYLDVAGDGALDGWNSFDYVINKTAPTATTAVLERFTGDGYATEVVAEVTYSVSGRYMTVKVAKADLGLAGDDYTVNFAWTDNVHDEEDDNAFSGDILDFYISGDVAPGGRFKYSYISVAESIGGDESDTDPGSGVETQPGETQPGETQPGETQPGETRPGETQPGETQPGETQPGETQPGETRPGETRPGETQPGETQPGETQPGETQSAETQPETAPIDPGEDETNSDTTAVTKPTGSLVFPESETEAEEGGCKSAIGTSTVGLLLAVMILCVGCLSSVGRERRRRMRP